MTDTTTPAAQDPNAVWVRETGEGLYQVDVEAGGAHFLADEPKAFGGLGSGPNPYDLLGAALGSCTAMTLRLYARRKSWPVDRVSVRVSHARSHLDGRDRFTRQITLVGDLTLEQRAKLADIANRCPVHSTLERGSEVVTEFLEQSEAGGCAETGPGHMRDMREACEAEGRG